jgi:glycosyltransferase involved in cell wall biosynthesis
MIKVSVIMTFFNESADLLKRSVTSILNQTFQDYEFIVIAGNPENTSGIEYMKSISSINNKINFIVGEKKLLMTICLNRAIKLAKGKYIAIQESDDESLPERLERELAVIEKNDNIDVIGTAIAYINNADKKVLVKRFYPEDPHKAFNKYTAIAHPTYMAKRELFEKYGYYDESEEVRNSPDHDLWCRWVIQGVRFYNIPEVLFNYYQSADNGRNKNAKKTLKSVVRLKKKYAREMNFTLQDYFYLNLERMLLLVPQSLISKLFYIWVKIKKV